MPITVDGRSTILLGVITDLVKLPLQPWALQIISGVIGLSALGAILYRLAGVDWEQIDLGEADALQAEIRAFVASVRTRARPAVTGEDGRDALELCERILSVMESE